MHQQLKFMFFALLLTACAPHHPTVAEQRNQQRAQDSVNYLTQQRSVAYLDSLLQVTLPRVDDLLSAFVYEKNERYENRGRYVHRTLRTVPNSSRMFLQVYIFDNGALQVRSHYVGTRALSHTGVQLIADSVHVTATGSVHSFETDAQHEMTTIDNESAWQLLRFIDGYSASRIKVTLEGKGKQTYFLSDRDKQALVESYRLAMLIRDVQQLESQLRQASLQVQKYKKRAEKTQ